MALEEEDPRLQQHLDFLMQEESNFADMYEEFNRQQSQEAEEARRALESAAAAAAAAAAEEAAAVAAEEKEDLRCMEDLPPADITAAAQDLLYRREQDHLLVRRLQMV